MDEVAFRYIVEDVGAASTFYCECLGVDEAARPGPGFAILVRGRLRLLLSEPAGSGGAAQAMPDGRRPEPGGWNRIQIAVDDLEADVRRLRDAGASFRNDIVRGRGGAQVLLDDPSGNPIELFQPAAR